MWVIGQPQLQLILIRLGTRVKESISGYMAPISAELPDSTAILDSRLNIEKEIDLKLQSEWRYP
jgi:hypothetical protein